MTFQPPPAPGAPYQPAQPAKPRGGLLLKLALIFFVVAVAGFVVGGVVGTKSQSKVDKFQRIPITSVADAENAQPATITFDKAGGYIAYYEDESVNSSIKKIPEPIVRMQGPTGEPFNLSTPYGNRTDNKIKVLTYDHGGHHGVAVYQFHISVPGSYKVLAASNITPAGAQMAFGTSIAKGTVTGGVLIGVGVLFLVAAIVLLIIGLVKRSRSRKEMAAAAQYGAAGYGAPGGYPPPPGAYPPPPGAYPPPGPAAQNFGTPQPSDGGYQPPPPPAGGYEPPAPPN